jgi:hypothetical protein
LNEKIFEVKENKATSHISQNTASSLDKIIKANQSPMNSPKVRQNRIRMNYLEA